MTSIGRNTRKPVAAASPMPRTADNAKSGMSGEVTWPQGTLVEQHAQPAGIIIMVRHSSHSANATTAANCWNYNPHKKFSTRDRPLLRGPGQDLIHQAIDEPRPAEMTHAGCTR